MLISNHFSPNKTREAITITPSRDLTVEDFEQVVLKGATVEISPESLKDVEASYDFLCEFAKHKVIYGVNTGFGPMAQYRVEDNCVKDLQYNLIRSHAAGTGEKIDDRSVKAAMLVRLSAISKGYSGIHPSTILLLKDMINKDIIPVIPRHGGVGASGDLVQLSHLALAMIGEGKVSFKGEIRNTADVFREEGLKPIEVKTREGLSLINGTSVMTGIGAINALKSRQLLEWCICSSAMMNEIVGAF